MKHFLTIRECNSGFKSCLCTIKTPCTCIETMNMTLKYQFVFKTYFSTLLLYQYILFSTHAANVKSNKNIFFKIMQET